MHFPPALPLWLSGCKNLHKANMETTVEPKMILRISFSITFTSYAVKYNHSSLMRQTVMQLQAEECH